MGEAVAKLMGLLGSEQAYTISHSDVRETQRNALNERLQERVDQIRLVKLRAGEAGVSEIRDFSDIVPLLVACPVMAKRISDILLAEYGLYVQTINFPTVPRGTERLRFTPGPWHDEMMQDELVKALVEIWDRLEIKLAA